MTPRKNLNEFFILGLCFCLLSCATQDMFESQGVPNGCAIDAVVKQCAIKAKAACDRNNIWAKILVVNYFDGELLVGHAYCIFEDADGVLWAYDWSGSRPLKTRKKDPLYIAAMLKNGVKKAYFADEVPP